MPLSLGYGLKINDRYNAVLLCKRCNNQKSSLLPTKFYTKSQLQILESTYDICTHKNDDTNNYKNIDIENLIDLYEKSLKDKISFYIDYLNYLWNPKKISKYRLKKEKNYKIYYIKDHNLKIMYGKIKYDFFTGKLVINDLKISLKDIIGVVLWSIHGES